jgi:hypothetical protein
MSEEEKGGLSATVGTQPIGLPAEHHAAHAPAFTLNLAGVPVPLRRTFAAIDRLFAIPIEVAGDALEKKLKTNLDSHVENVQMTRRKKGKKENVENPSLKTTRAIAEWARRAAEIDTEERDLSSLWEALLDAIMDDAAEGERLLAIVKEAQPSDIRFFLARFVDSPPRFGGVFGRMSAEPGQWGRLEGLGLVGRILPANGLATLCIIAAVALYTIDDLAPLRIIGAPQLSTTASFFRTIGDYGIPLGGLFAICFYMGYVVYEPTKLGRELRERYLKYNKGVNRMNS